MVKGRNGGTLTPFKKGNDPRRNKEGRPPKLPELDTLMAEVLAEERSGKSAAKVILQKLITKAKAGNIRAAEVLLDRAYGKAKQVTEEIGETKIKVTITKAK